MSEPRTCGTCRFWDTAADLTPFVNERESRLSEGLDENATAIEWDSPWRQAKEEIKAWGECTAILKKEDADDNAIAQLSDGSGYYAALATKAEFGCTLWQSKP